MATGVKRTFKNEIGNTITITIEETEDTLVEITMEGPNSTMSNTITRREAEFMKSLLEAFLQDCWR